MPHQETLPQNTQATMTTAAAAAATHHASHARRKLRSHLGATAFVVLVACGSASGVHAQQATKVKPPVPTEIKKAQTDSAPKSESDSTSKVESTDTVRARRVVSTEEGLAPKATLSTTTVAAPTVVMLPSQTQGDSATKYGSTTPTKDVASSAATAPTVVDEELESLRLEVKDAATDAERARLQHAVVNRLIETERKTEAIDELRAMMREERFDPAHFYNIGNALARLSDAQTAVEAYRKAIGQRRGNYARAQNNLGVVLLRLGRLEDAAESFEAALRLENGNYAEASYNMGRVHALRGEAALAIREWTRTLYTEPDHTDAAVALARAHAEGGDYPRALKVLDSFAARFSTRGASVPRVIAVTRGEIVAAANVVASEKNDNPPAAPVSEKRQGHTTPTAAPNLTPKP